MGIYPNCFVSTFMILSLPESLDTHYKYRTFAPSQGKVPLVTILGSGCKEASHLLQFLTRKVSKDAQGAIINEPFLTIKYCLLRLAKSWYWLSPGDFFCPSIFSKVFIVNVNFFCDMNMPLPTPPFLKHHIFLVVLIENAVTSGKDNMQHLTGSLFLCQLCVCESKHDF